MNYSELLQLAKGWSNLVSNRIIIWRLRATRDWSLPDTVYLNPDKVHEQSEEADDQMAVSSK